MPHRRTRALDLVVWLIVAFVGLVVLSQAIGWTGWAPVAILQSLTPYLAVAVVLVVLVALLRRRPLAVTVAAAVLFGIVVLGTPLAFPDGSPPAAADSAGLRVASLNLWFRNREIDAVADELATIDADVIVFVEYTHEHQAALEASPLADDFPYRSQRASPWVTGVVVWSRYPIDAQGPLSGFHDSVDVHIQGPDGGLRLLGAHLPTPIADLAKWTDELTMAARIGRNADEPTLLIGDLNASYWHPGFRDLLDAGFVDAHTALGAGLSTSWPTDLWFPPFVRLDHALTAGGLVSTDVYDIDIPGSDHRGLVVTVAPAR